jgi:hypothetical protein
MLASSWTGRYFHRADVLPDEASVDPRAKRVGSDKNERRLHVGFSLRFRSSSRDWAGGNVWRDYKAFSDNEEQNLDIISLA